MMKENNIFFTLARIGLGLVFLWAFFDKLFGLGFATPPGAGWIHGGSPTLSYLSFATHGPLANFYHAIAGNFIVNWLFMLGLLGLGIALVSGKFLKIAGYGGALLMLLMWSTVLPPTNNPLIDEHIIYGLFLLGIAHSAPEK